MLLSSEEQGPLQTHLRSIIGDDGDNNDHDDDDDDEDDVAMTMAMMIRQANHNWSYANVCSPSSREHTARRKSVVVGNKDNNDDADNDIGVDYDLQNSCENNDNRDNSGSSADFIIENFNFIHKTSKLLMTETMKPNLGIFPFKNIE